MLKSIKKLNWKKILFTSIWVLVAVASAALLVAAIDRRDAKICTGIDIQLAGGGDNFFVDKQDVIHIINQLNGNNIIGKSTKEFNLFAIEKGLKKIMWISKAEIFFDNNGKLQVIINQKEPIARVFTKKGESFYIDSTKMILPLCDNHVARVPVFTDFPLDSVVLSRLDSSLLNDIKSISLVIQKDSFLMSLIDQVSINSLRQFEMVPKIGDQMILFGDAGDIQLKFNKLKLFYKKVIPVNGLNKYSLIDLNFKNQIVTRIKGKEDVAADSLLTIEYLKVLAANSAKKASDSSRNILPENEKSNADISIILESLERDEDTVRTKLVSQEVNRVSENKSEQNKKTPEKSKETDKKPKQKVVSKVSDKKNKSVSKQKILKKEEKKKSTLNTNDY